MAEVSPDRRPKLAAGCKRRWSAVCIVVSRGREEAAIKSFVAHTVYSLDLHRALRDGNGAAHGMAWSPYSVWCSLAWLLSALAVVPRTRWPPSSPPATPLMN